MHLPSRPLINVTIPVYNEQTVLAQNVDKVVRFLKANCPYRTEIVIANNASTDRTLEIARSLESQFDGVRVLHLERKGRGIAVKAAWRKSEADILSYMDVDLSTDLESFPALIKPLLAGEFDLAVGSRLLKTSRTRRGLKREIISRVYNLLVRGMFQTRFSDAQCGFKAITRQAATRLLPAVEDNDWFMDTELLINAERTGCRILDLPVQWLDDPDSRVKILTTAMADIKGLIRVRRNLGHLPGRNDIEKER